MCVHLERLARKFCMFRKVLKYSGMPESLQIETMKNMVFFYLNKAEEREKYDYERDFIGHVVQYEVTCLNSEHSTVHSERFYVPVNISLLSFHEIYIRCFFLSNSFTIFSERTHRQKGLGPRTGLGRTQNAPQPRQRHHEQRQR